MKIRSLIKRNKAIKKPNWFKSFLAFALIFAVLGVFVWTISVNAFQESLYFSTNEMYINTYISEIAKYGGDGFSDEELDSIAHKMPFRQAIFRIPAIITVDGEELCNSAYSMVGIVHDSKANEDRVFHAHWNPDDKNVQKLLDYQNTISLLKYYSLRVLDYYVDNERDIIYIGKVEVTEESGVSLILNGELGADIGNASVHEVVDITPADKSLLEGLTYVDNTAYYLADNADEKDHLTNFFISGPVGIGEDNIIDTPEYMFGSSTHHVYVQFDDSYSIEVREYLARFYAWVIGICAVILALILGTIWYFRKKSTYNIFEYRRKTTNAMAHDLKTPLAIASLSVANLKENLGVNNERVEHHANEIDESISYMDKLICNILEFSNSESVNRKLSKENVDVKAELESYRSEISKVLTDAKMTLDISGEATRVTDRKIWNQAITNLIDNAVKHGVPGSSIKVELGQKEITITNSVDEDVLNVESLREPFAKGDARRGENSGSGLGLSIADNNLSALGYKLKLNSKDKKFIVTIY